MERFVNMWSKAFTVTCIILLTSFAVKAQHENPAEAQFADSSEMFGKILNTGKFEFHLRSYFMHTNNADGLLDYSAWGSGAGLGYFSPRWKGLGVGFSGFFVFRHLERNLTIADPKTGLRNRYELTLFDVHHPDNYKDLDRLEEFFMSYEDEKFSAWFGRHHFESPLLNASDNRLRPNLFSGFSGAYSATRFRLSAAWFSHLISRGSLEWLTAGESLGFYSTGRNPDGSSESYKHHISSKGIGVLGLEYNDDKIEVQNWSYLAEGVFATNFTELKGSIPLDVKKRLLYGVQGFYQQAVGNGGNNDPSKAYTLPDEKTYGMGLRTGLEWENSELTANFLYISDEGRFLFPREWGREKFFVSMQRERLEGMGGVHAFGINYDKTLIHEKLKISVGASHVQTPGLENLTLNKYGLPNYFHFIGLIDYRFDGYFKGLDLQLLVAHKNEDSAREIPLEYVINRVNMTNLNLILDYRF
jgi:hypothetical protein